MQYFIYLELSVFSFSEPFNDYEYFIIEDHPLSFFISLEPGWQFIFRVLDTGIDVNGTGYSNSSFLTPLRAAATNRDIELVKELVSQGL